MLPQLGFVVEMYAVPVTVRSVVQDVVDHKPVETFTDIEVTATAQPASHESLTIGDIDFSLQYLQVHSQSELEIGYRVIFQGKSFKIVNLGDYNLYGYYTSVAEEMKDE